MTEVAGTPWRIAGGAVTVRIRLTPKGGRDEIGGLTNTPEGPAIKARVHAAPEDNAANDALTVLVAGWLGVARRDVGLVWRRAIVDQRRGTVGVNYGAMNATLSS